MLRFRLLSYSNFGRIEQWYEEMSEKGWEIQSVKFSMIHHFKKTSPKKEDYEIMLSPNEGKFSALSTDEIDDLNELAKERGWEFIDRSYNMNIYKKSKDAEESLYQEDEEELNILRKGVQGELVSLVISLIMAFLLSWFISGSFFGTDVFYSNPTLFGFFGIYILIFLAIGGILDYTLFQRTNKEVKRKQDLKFTKIIDSKIYNIFIVIGLMLAILMPFSQVLSNISSSNFKRIGYFLLTPLIPLISVWIFRRKIKASPIKTSTKRVIFIISLMLLPVLITTMNLYLTGDLGDELSFVEKGHSFEVKILDRSFLTKSHLEYFTEDLIIEKTVTRNEKLAEILFDRMVKKSKDPSSVGEIKDHSLDFSYDKIYLSDTKDYYLILFENQVLKVEGDIYQMTTQEEIIKILGDANG